MPPSITKDHIADQSTIRYDGLVPRELTRGMFVEGLSEGSGCPYQAIETVKTAGIRPWSEHPYPNLNKLRVLRYEFEPAGPFAGWVRVGYVNCHYPEYSGGAALRMVSDNRNRFDVPQTVLCEGSPDRPIPLKYQLQTGVVTAMAPDPMFAVRRIQPTLDLTGVPFDPLNYPINPTQLCNEWVGTINNDYFQEGAPGAWLLESINWAYLSFRVAYVVDYQLRYRVKGWQPDAIYIERETGEPHPDIAPGVGRKTVEWYEAKNFGLLSLVGY